MTPVTIHDTYLTLRDADSVVLAWNAGGTTIPGDNSALIVFTPTQSGTYYLSAGATLPSSTGRYTVSATVATVLDDYPNNISTPGTLTPGTAAAPNTFAGTVETGYDRDWIAVHLDAGGLYKFTMAGSPPATPTLGLQRYVPPEGLNQGSLLAAPTLYVGNWPSIFYVAPTQSGTYYLDAGYNGGLYTGTYTVTAAQLANVDDYAGNAGTSGAVSVGGSASGRLEIEVDHDWFAVTLTGGTKYQLRANNAGGSSGLANPFLDLRDSSGNLLGSNDDDVVNPNALITYAPTTTGTYYLDVSASNLGYAGNYTVSVVSTPPDDYRDDTSTTGVIPVGGSSGGTFEVPGDRDWFRITLTAGVPYVLSESAVTVHGSFLTLHDATGTNLAFASFYPPNDHSVIEYRPTASGTYYLDAGSTDSPAGGTYTVSVGVAPAAALTPGTAASPGSASGTLGPAAGETDYYAVNLVAGRVYEFRANANASGPFHNGRLHLYQVAANVDGAPVLSDVASDLVDDQGSGLYYSTAQTGTYYLAASNPVVPTGVPLNFFSGTYTVTAAQLDVSDDHAGTFGSTADVFKAGAGALSVDGSAAGRLEFQYDRDWYAVTLTAGNTYHLRLDSAGAAGLADPYLTLYSSSGAVLAETDDSVGSLDALIAFAAETTGTYYLGAQSSRFQSKGTGDYSVSVTATPSDQVLASTATTATLDIGSPTSGRVETNGDHDWYRIVLDAGTTYQFRLDNAGGAMGLRNPYLVLRDAAGSTVASNDDGGGGLNSLITYVAPSSGVYFLDAGSLTAISVNPSLIKGSVDVFFGDYTLSATNLGLIGGPGDDSLTGGAGDDTLWGAGGDDSLTGGGGNDTLHGDAGTNKAIYSGTYDDYGFSTTGGVLTVTDLRPGTPDGTDTVTDVQLLGFGDGSEYVIGTITSLTVGAGGHEFVASGGQTIGATVSTGGTLTVLAGGITSGSVISSGGAEINHGTAVSAVVGWGGELDLFNGAMASGTTTSRGGATILYAGASAFGGTLAGFSEVGSGAVASGVTILSGGRQNVSGTTIGTVVSNGGLDVIYAGGAASGTVVLSGGVNAVHAGASASGTVVSNGGLARTHGTTVGAVVRQGGWFEVSAGVASNTTTSSGGATIVFSGASALGGTLAGFSEIGSGAVASGVTILSGGRQNVFGVATGTVVSDGGRNVVYAGGVTSGSVISSGGVEINHGTAMSAVVGWGGELDVFNGAVASGTTTSRGGVTILYSGASAFGGTLAGFSEVGVGAVASGVTILSGGRQNVSGTTSGTVVSSGGLNVIYGGGVASGTVVSARGVDVIYAGASASGTVVSNGGLARTYGTTVGAVVRQGGWFEVSAGVASNTATSSGGGTIVFSGASALGGTLAGFSEIGSGAVASGITILSGGRQNVSGTAIGTVVSNGGLNAVYAGGVTSGTVLSTGGLENTLGTTVSAMVKAGGVLNVYGGAVASATTTSAGGVVIVYSGGTLRGESLAGFSEIGVGAVASNVTILGGGRQNVSGTVSGTVVSNGGQNIVYAGGITHGTVVSSGGYESIFAGGVTSGTVVSTGGLESNHGTVVDAHVKAGGELDVWAGAVASGTTTSAGGATIVFSGGTVQGGSLFGFSEIGVGAVASGVTIQNGARQNVSGTTSGTVLLSGSFDAVYAGGVTIGTIISNGGLEANHGTTINAQVKSGGELDVWAGAVASGTTTSSGGVTIVFSGGIVRGGSLIGFSEIGYDGVASGVTILSGGRQNVSGTVVGTVVSNGGLNVIYAYGVASNSFVSSGGVEQIYGTLSGGTVASAGLIRVQGMASATTVLSGGSLVAQTGGTISGATLSGGQLDIFGGTASGTLVSGAGQVTVYSGGRASGTTLFGVMYVESGGAVSGTIVSSGGHLYLASGATAAGTAVSFNGRANVLSGATASGGTVLHGGVLVVSGGSVSGTTVFSGGFLSAVSGGAVNATTLSGGWLDVWPGRVSGTLVLSGGVERLHAGSVGSGTVVASGGFAMVDDGATAAGMTVSAGGVVQTNGALVDAIVHSGGRVNVMWNGFVGATLNGGLIDVISSGGTGGVSTIGFASGGGTLLLEDSQHFSGVLSGFGGLGDVIDFADIAFGGGTTLGYTGAADHTSGTLTVSAGGHSASLTLLGQYAAADFNLASDGFGGTRVTAPSVVDTGSLLALNHP